jgi:two-component system OmpR family sensor kinase
MTAVRGAATTARRVWANVPLRIRLVLAVLALVALALTVTGTAGTRALDDYLLQRVDRQLELNAHDFANRVMHDGEGPGPPPGGASPYGNGGFGPRLPGPFYARQTDQDGVGVGTERLLRPDGSEQTGPRLPTLTMDVVEARNGTPFTVPSTGAGYDWRVLVTELPDGSGAVTVASSLDDVVETTGRLARINLLVGLVVLVVLGVLGYLVVRSSLRQLVEVETTAEAIAAGDLTRRVPNAGTRTEVGRLATALNTMLAQIETSFAAEQASEATARASEDRMRRFVADASHELRTPLTSIRGFAELHRQGAVPDEEALAKVMDRIETEATRMGLLVEDLLLLARLDQQRPLEREPVDLLPIAADTVGDAGMLAPDHPTSLQVQGGEDTPPPVVLGDEARLRQVVANLVANAWRHTPPGTEVTVRLASTAETAVVEVADNGPGLPPDDAARAFERFYRADPSRTRAQGGTGLGLSIVAALVAAHGGTVELESTPGTGARFTVKLPLYRPADAPAPAPTSRP